MSSIRGVNVGGSLFDVTDSSNVAPIETTNFASRPYAKDRCFIMADGLLYRATAQIESGDPIVINANCRRTILDEIISVIETDSDLIAPTEDEATSSDGYEVGDEIVRSGILYNVISAIAEGDAFVIGNNIDIAGTLTSQIKTLVNNDDAILNVLGAKNLLPNEATTQTLNGITFTVNPDGSVKVSGTAASTTPFIVYVNNFTIPKSGKYIVSGNPNAEKTFMQVMDKTDSTNHVFSSVGDEEYNFDSTHTYQMRLAVVAGKTVNEMFYPMIRPAEVADDTYVPYAKTNKQLTDDLDIVLKVLTYDSSKGTIIGHYTKVGHVVTVNFRIVLAEAVSSGSDTYIGRITNLPSKILPSYSKEQITWVSRDASRGGFIDGYIIIDPYESSDHGVVVAGSGTAQVGDILYITISYITE